jgi:hypothetical protein
LNSLDCELHLARADVQLIHIKLDIYLELDVISLNSLDCELHLARADFQPTHIKLDIYLELDVISLNSLDCELHLARADVQPNYAVKQAGQSNTALHIKHKVKDEHAIEVHSRSLMIPTKCRFF